MLDQFEIDALKKVDEYIVTGLVAPAETVPQLPQLRDIYKEKVITGISASSYKPAKESARNKWARHFIFAGGDKGIDAGLGWEPCTYPIKDGAKATLPIRLNFQHPGISNEIGGSSNGKERVANEDCKNAIALD